MRSLRNAVIRTILAVGLLAPLAIATAPASDAGAPGKWTKISTGTVSLINEPGLFRTSDGVLHVVYERDASGKDTIGHTAIKATGAIKLQNVVVSGWSTIVEDPKAVALPGGGIRVVFGGIQTLSAGFWSDGRIYTATGNAAGSAWALPTDAIGMSHSGYASYGTGATTLADGTPIASFPLNSTLTWHVGTTGDPDTTYDHVACCIYNSTLVRDGSAVYAAFYSNASMNAKNGTFLKQIYPSAGATVRVPGSSQNGNSVQPLQSVAMAARKGGGVFVAFCVGYPTCKYVGLWKYGTTTVRRVPKSGSADGIAISAGPQGRLWIAWESNVTGKAYAVRTNTAAAKFGAVRTLGRPGGTSSIYKIAIEGTAGRGDVVINTGNGLFHQQVLPGLSLSASPTKWDGDFARTVTFTVRDAGAPVANAHVKVGTRACTTGSGGSCTISFPSLPAGKLGAAASHAGYAKASLRLTVLS